jgi:hypothetical protein
LKEANKPKSFKDFFEEAETRRDEVSIDGHVDWGLIMAKTGTGKSFAERIASLMNKGATL